MLKQSTFLFKFSTYLIVSLPENLLLFLKIMIYSLMFGLIGHLLYRGVSSIWQICLLIDLYTSGCSVNICTIYFIDVLQREQLNSA